MKLTLKKAFAFEKAVKGILAEKVKKDVAYPLFELEDAIDCALRIARKKLSLLETEGRDLADKYFSESVVAGLKTDAAIQVNNARYQGEVSRLNTEQEELLNSEIEIDIRADLTIPSEPVDALDIPGEYRRVLLPFLKDAK